MIRLFGRRVGALILAGAVLLAAVACGSDDDSTSTSTSAPAASGSTSSTSASAPAGATDSTVESTSTPVSGGMRTVPTHYGDVEVPMAPQRVVAVSYDTPWQLQAAGVKPVAVQDYGKWISEFTADQQAFIDGVATIGSFGELNLEAIAAANPDLIVGDAYEIDEPTYEQLKAIAPTAIATGDSRGDWKAISGAVADAAGAGDVATEAKATYDAELARITSTYAEQLALPWAHISLGDTEAAFSVQFPTGVVGRMLFDELGATWAPSLPDGEPGAGYESYSFEAMGTILADVEVVVHYLRADGSDNPAIANVLVSEFFNPPAKAAGHVFGLTTSVTDYVTATQYIQEIERTILEPLG